MEKRTKESRKRINSLILLIAFTAIMLIVSTYAWFTSQKDITLSNLRGTVEVAENMEISLDAKSWHQEIDLSEAADVFAEAQTSRNEAKDASGATLTGVTNLAAILPTQLLPVSGADDINTIKTKTTLPLYEATASSATATLAGNTISTAKLAGIAACTEPEDNGYFAFDIYIKNTSKDGLADILQLNLNSSVQVLPADQSITKEIVENGVNSTRTYEGDAASGLQNTVRVGLALYADTASSTATQAEILTATHDSLISDVAIWEPNAKDHIETIVNNNNKLSNGTQVHTTFADGAAVDTYGLTEAADTANTINNVYDVSSTGLALQGTFKTDKTSDTDYRIKPVTEGKPINITNTSGNNFQITSNTVSRLRVYVWLEGQDVDCINVASEGGGIEVDLGLTKDDEVGDVLTRASAGA